MFCFKNLVLTALTMTASAVASPAEPAVTHDSGRDVQMCIAEVAKHADYDGATRVVHLVHASQKNLAERQFRIDTTVYTGDEQAARSYRSDCVTFGAIRMVDFRLKPGET